MRFVHKYLKPQFESSNQKEVDEGVLVFCFGIKNNEAGL